MTPYQKKILLVVATALAGGGIPVFSKLLLREIGPTEFMTLRFFGAWLLFLPFVIKALPRKISDWLKISLVVMPAAINMILFARGLFFTTATMAALIYSFSPIAAAIMVYFIGQEKLNWRKIIGILIGFIGMLILIIAPLNYQSLADFVGTAKGNGLMLLCMMLMTIFTVASKPLQQKFSPAVITSILFLNCFIVNAIAGGYTIFNPSLLLKLSTTAWLSLGYLIFINSIIFFWLYQITLKQTTAVNVSMTSYITPIITFVWAAILLGERLNSVLVIAGALTLTGAYLTTTAKNHGTK